MIDYLSIITAFREKAFDAANSGRFGNYSDDLEEFNEEVEDGFTDNDTKWESEDGRLVLSCSSLLWNLNNGADQKTLEFLQKNQDGFDDWKMYSNAPLYHLFSRDEDWVSPDLDVVKSKALDALRKGDEFLEINVVNWSADDRLRYEDYEDLVERGILQDNSFCLKETLFSFRTEEDEFQYDFPVMSVKDAVKRIENLTHECFWQPVKKDKSADEPLPEELSSFDVFASKEDCVSWLKDNGENPEEYDIRPCYLKDIIGPTIISNVDIYDNAGPGYEYDCESTEYLVATVFASNEDARIGKVEEQAYAIVGSEHLEMIDDEEIEKVFRSKLSIPDDKVVVCEACDESEYEENMERCRLVSFLGEGLCLDKQFAIDLSAYRGRRPEQMP